MFLFLVVLKICGLMVHAFLLRYVLNCPYRCRTHCQLFSILERLIKVLTRHRKRWIFKDEMNCSLTNQDERPNGSSINFSTSFRRKI